MKSELQRLCESRGVRIISTYGLLAPGKTRADLDDWQKRARPYRCVLRYKGHQMTVYFFMGPAWAEKPKQADVLACMISDAHALEGSFESWAQNLGYDTDSRKIERAYNECRKSGKKIRRLLGKDFDLFARAEH